MSLLEWYLPVAANQHARLLFEQRVPIKLEEALIDVLGSWWAYPRWYPVRTVLAVDRLDAKIIAAHKAIYLEQQAQKKAAAGVSQRRPGTRSTRGKRKAKGGRR